MSQVPDGRSVDGLIERVSALIERGRRVAAARANAALTLTYWTALPPKEDLEDRLAMILREARERLARRALAPSPVTSKERP